jgi:4-amino-4-deoxy-L-arabinose transferase-like glycosyltransferase
MHDITLIKRRDLIVLCVILMIAGWMRLGRGQIVEYFHDDAMLATLALQMADGENFPLTGILSSTGIPNPPTSVYVMAIPFSLSSDPNFAIHSVMILNVVGVGLLWLIAHRYFGRDVGIIASLMYALNPWAVLFSRKIWAQDFHTPFILLGILLLLYGFWEASDRQGWKQAIAQTLSIPILLFAFQIHFAALALAPIILVALWIGRKRIIWSALILSFILSACILAPYLMGLTQTLEQDPTRISDAAGRSSASDGISLTSEPIISTVYLSSGTGLETWIAPDQQHDLSGTYPPFTQIGFLFSLFMILGVIVIWKRHQQFTLFFLMWAFLPQLALILNWTPVYTHYFIPSIPALLLLVGVGVGAILQLIAQQRIVSGLAWGLILAMLGLKVIQWHTILDYVDTQHIPYPGFTTPISDLNSLRADLQEAEDVLVISQGMSWNLHHEVAVWDTLLWDDVGCVRTLIGDGYAVFPEHQFSVVIAPDAPQNPVNNLYQSDNPIQYETRKGDNGYTLFQWETSPQWTHATIQEIDTQLFDSGVKLTGYALENDTVYLEWRLPTQHKGADYQYSAQLFDSDSNRLDQLDKTFWHGRHWCTNDRLITWGTLPADTDATTLSIGMYRLGTGSQLGQFFNANILDELGNPIGQSVEIPLD